MKSMGKQKSDNPKSEQLTVRVDKEHLEILKEYCEKENVQKAEAIRRGIRKLKEDYKRLYQQRRRGSRTAAPLLYSF